PSDQLRRCGGLRIRAGHRRRAGDASLCVAELGGDLVAALGLSESLPGLQHNRAGCPLAAIVTSRQPFGCFHTAAALGCAACSSASRAATDRVSVMATRSL